LSPVVLSLGVLLALSFYVYRSFPWSIEQFERPALCLFDHIDPAASDENEREALSLLLSSVFITP